MSIKTECQEIVEKINFDGLNHKKILITGASGLIGVYLTSCLKEIYIKNNIEVFVWIKNKIEKEFVSIFDWCNII